MDPEFVTSTDDELSIHVNPGSATLFLYPVPSQLSLFLARKPFHTPISHVAMLEFLLQFWKERNQNFTIQSMDKT